MPADWVREALSLRESGLSCDEIAKKLNKKRSTVSELLRRCEKLIPEALEAFLSGRIGVRASMMLAELSPEKQEDVLSVLNGEDDVSRLRSEIKALRAEKKVLEREVARLRAPSLLASRLRRLVLNLEREEPEIAELSAQVDLRDYYLEAQRWMGVFRRYEGYVRRALGGKVIVLDAEREKKNL
ncbi:MAG: hypothetical protein ACPLTR_04135 [Thermacetogeniaceae bacterium]